MPTPVFSFSTTTVDSGHTIRIYSTSQNWKDYMPGDATSATLTIKSFIDGEKIFTDQSGTPIDTYTKTLLPTQLVDDFVIDLKSIDLFNTDKIVPDCVLVFKIDIANTAQDTYTSIEVFYYNSWVVKSTVCYNAVNQICDINSTEIKYACMVNMLYQGLLSDIVVGNTNGIYEKIDIFKRLTV